jgi:predicted LPLAT superfamily acyltransferase
MPRPLRCIRPVAVNLMDICFACQLGLWRKSPSPEMDKNLPAPTPVSTTKMAASDSQTTHWSGTGQLRGGRWGIWFFIAALRVLGLRLTCVLAMPCAIYFSLVSPDVPATMAYHRRIFGKLSWWRRRWLVFKHFFSFGRALIDRTAILAGRTKFFSFSFEGEHHLREALAGGRGVLLLTAHLGNWEAAGQLLSRLDVPVNVTGFDNESAEIRSLLNRSANAKFRLLPLTGAPTDVIPLLAALRRGEIVAMLGDRTYHSPSMPVKFLGGPAAFPVGAYVMAALAGAPLVHVFNLREPGGHYHFFGFPPQHPQMPPHSERDAYLQKCAARFAGDLETILKRDPLQWYNFFPFWEQPVSTSSRAELGPHKR